MSRVAVFIDAGYLLKQTWKYFFPDTNDQEYSRSAIEFQYSAFRQTLLEYLNHSLPQIPLLRCYWYDGPGLYGQPAKYHETISFMNDFKLRLGDRVADASDGRTKQKGVDGLIIADLIGHAQNKSITHALLISGDGDMVPGVSVAQALGIRVHLLVVTSEKSTSPKLRSEVDFIDLWSSVEIQKFARFKKEKNEQFSNSKPASTVSSATKNPSEGLDMENLVKAMIEQLSEEDISRIKQSFIPSDIDSRLLRQGYEWNGHRALVEKQKRQLREYLKKQLFGKKNI